MGIFSGLSQPQADEQVMQDQPRNGFFRQMFANRMGVEISPKAQKQQDLASRIMNEETQTALTSQGDSVDLAAVLPSVFFNAAKRITALGNPEMGQQLYAKGLEATDKMQQSQAKLDLMKAQTRNADEQKTPYLETLKQLTDAQDQVQKFPEGSPTRVALEGNINRLNEQLDKLNTESNSAGQSELNSLDQSHYRETGQHLSYDEKLTYLQNKQMTAKNPQDYKLYVRQEQDAGRKPASYADWLPSHVTEVGAATKTGETVPVRLDALEEEAQLASRDKASVQYALNFLNKGINTGTGAEARTWLARAMDTFVGKPTDNNAVVSDTAGYIAATTPLVLNRIRALAPVTEDDRNYIAKVSGGDISLDEESLRHTLEIAAKTADSRIARYNTRLSNLGPEYATVQGAGYKPVPVTPLDFTKPKMSRPPPGSSPDALAKFYLQHK
jgi:hypothetical protein